ncbi:MAG: acetolactate synthase [Phycisphaerae bacterium]|nr:acetolactate synthase [Phycisphaerae bacterium]
METESYQTARAHETPFAVQFSVFMPNRVGQLLELLDALAPKDVQIVGVSVVDATDWAVVRLIFTQPDQGRILLKTAGHSFTESEVLLVELLSDETLREVCSHLLQGEINVHFAYPLTIRRHGNAVMAFHVDDIILARTILLRHGLTLVGWEDLSDPGGAF